MTALLILAAVALAPMAVLLVAGPGELDLMTTPKNLGLPGAEIPTRAKARHLGIVETVSGVGCAGATASATGSHAAAVPAGMRPVGANA